MRWYKLLIMLFVLISLFIGCSNVPRNWWTEPVIAVMADSTEWAPMQSVLRQTFERVIKTPQAETLFSIRQVPDARFNHYSSFQYLMVAATQNSQGPVGSMIKGVLADSSVQARMDAGEFIVFSQRNQWAQDQLVVILLAKDVYILRDNIEANGQYLYSLFNDDFSDRMMADLLDGRIDEEIEEYLMTSFGWSLKLHQDYIIAHEDEPNGVIWFRRTYPERWVLVHWIENADTSMLTQSWVVNERNQLGKKYYGNDQVVDEYLFSHKGEFLNRPAQITQGLWENEEKVAGGPFKNYTFYDEVSSRLYMVDLAVHAPHREKIPLLRRQEQIAKTFYTIFEKNNK